MWPIFIAHQNITRCADRRNRLYSVLGLLENGESLYVGYEEETTDLFWLGGEHFKMWYSSYSVVLQEALRLNIGD